MADAKHILEGYTKDQLETVVDLLGGQRATAKVLEIPRTTLQMMMGRSTDDGVAPTEDVTTPEGRKALRAQAHIRDLRTRNNKLSDKLFDQEEFFEKVARELVESRPNPKFSARYNGGKNKLRDVIAPIYDCQFGTKTRPQDTPYGIGEFNASVFERRLDTYVSAMTQEIADHAASHTMETAVIVLGGDMVEGDEIFGEQSWQLEFDPIEQMIKLCHLMSHALHEIIGFLREEVGVKRIAILCIHGNHGKAGGRRKAGRPMTYNWDYGFYKMLAKEMENYPLDVFTIETGGAVLFASQGHLFSAVHGDEVRGWGGIPFYGLTRFDAKSIRLINKIPDYVLLGHHHQPASIPIGYGEHIMSGNWVGANQHTKDIQASNLPSQNLIYVSRKYGANSMKIMLETMNKKPDPFVYLED